MQNIDSSRYEMHLGYAIGDDVFFKELIANPERSHYFEKEKRGAVLSWIHFIRTVRRLKPDLIHFYMQSANFAGGLGHYFFRKIPIIFSVGMSRQPWWHYSAYRILKNRPSLTICNSREILKELVERSGFAENKIRVVHNPLDCEKFRPFDPAAKAKARETFGFAQGEMVIASVGRFSHQKHQHGTVEAIHRLSIASRLPENVRFLFVGKSSVPKYEKKLRALIQRYRLEKRISLHEPISDIVAFYNAVDGVFQPSHHEGLSNVVIECQASGTPVALSREGDNDHLIEHGKTGISLSIASSAQIADGLQSLIELCGDPARRGSVVRQAREEVSRRFSMREAILLRQEIYDELLKESRCPALQDVRGEA